MKAGRGTRHRAAGWVGLVLVAGCAAPLAPEAADACIAYMQFDGATYLVEAVLYQGALTPGAIVGQIARNVGCNDTPNPDDPPAHLVPEDGDSNFLPLGTKIHAVEGFPPSQRLAVRPDTTWIFLQRWNG